MLSSRVPQQPSQPPQPSRPTTSPPPMLQRFDSAPSKPSGFAAEHASTMATAGSYHTLGSGAHLAAAGGGGNNPLVAPPATTNPSITTKTIIQRLRSTIALQESTLRNLREPLVVAAGGGGNPTRSGGAFSTVASSHNASSVATPSQFHVASKRRWCAELQAVVQSAMKDTTISVTRRLDMVNECIASFEDEAYGVSVRFLERYLGDDAAESEVSSTSLSMASPSPPAAADSPVALRSTVNPGSSSSETIINSDLAAATGGGNSGTQAKCSSYPCEWATATQVGHGEFLTITLLDCEDNSAAVAAAKEQTSHMRVLLHQMLFLPRVLVHIAPRCTVQWRGRILLVAAQSLLVGDPHSVTECTELATVMSLMTDTCHLARYFLVRDDETNSSSHNNNNISTVSSNAAGNTSSSAGGGGGSMLNHDDDEAFVAGHPSATARLGSDGRWYLSALTSLFPHFPPARGSSISKRHTLCLRPESLMTDACKARLSPAAFLVYGSRDSTTRNTHVREWSQYVCHSMMQRLAQHVTERHVRLSNSGSGDVGSPASWDGAALSVTVHEHGVNIGLLGLLLTFLQGDVATFVFSEMISRVCRDHLRSLMSKRVELDETTRVISEYMSELSRPESFAAVWQDELFQRTAKKFAGYGSFFSEHATRPPYHFIDRTYFIRRLPQLLGIVFATGVSGFGTSSFHFPVKSVSATIRRFRLQVALLPAAARILDCVSPFLANKSDDDEDSGSCSAVVRVPHPHAVFPMSFSTLSGSTCRWFPTFATRRLVLSETLSHAMRTASACSAEGDVEGRGGEQKPSSKPPPPTFLRWMTSSHFDPIKEVDAWLKSFLEFEQQVLPSSIVIATSTPDYAVLLLDAAMFLRSFHRCACSVTGNNATATDDNTAPAAASTTSSTGRLADLALEYVKFGMNVLKKHINSCSGGGGGGGNDVSEESSNGSSSMLMVLFEAELARCLMMSPATFSEGLRTLDSAFQHAAAVSVSCHGRRTTGFSTTPRVGAGRSSQSSAEAQSLPIPVGLQPPPATWALVPQAAQAARGASATAQRSGGKMSVSIIAEGDDGRSGGGDFGGGGGGASCGASTVMPDSEARGLSRSHDVMSLSDLDPREGARTAYGFTALALELAAELADVLERDEKIAEAEPSYRYAVHASMAIFGPVHPSVSTSVSNLAVNLLSQQKCEEAEQLFRQDIEISEALFGPKHPNVSSAVNNLACLLDQLQRFDESEPLFRRDLDISRTVLGVDHPNVATAENNLAASYLRRGMLDQASEMFQSALAIREKCFGPRSIPVAEVLFNLSTLAMRKGVPAETKAAWDRCLETWRLVHGDLSPKLLPILENLCLACEECGDYIRSEELMDYAFRIKSNGGSS